jgi:Cysteine sulfinate desulfinase/cysteine desulfurase and related enzymes
MVGGGQERGLRPGTENVPFIAGLGRAAVLAARRMEEESARILALRDRLHRLLQKRIPGLRLNGDPDHRLPGTLNLSFPGVSGRELLAHASGLSASVGSACHEEAAQTSGVLGAMGLEPARARGAVRLSLGRFTTEEEVEEAASRLVGAWRAITT